MKRIFALICVTAGLACDPASPPPDPDVSWIVRGVTVVDVETGELLADRCIAVSGDRIRSVAPCDADPDAALDGVEFVDGRGRFAVPGLWDMHVHLTDATEVALPALVAAGVTTVRDMGGDLERIDRWREEIESGDRVGPRIYRSGPLIDGPKPGVPHRMTVERPEEARAAIAGLIDRGVDFIKIHNAVPREAYFALMDRARARNVSVVGHVPVTVDPIEAVDAGQASLEHVATIFEGTFQARHEDPFAALDAMESFTDEGAVELARRMVERGCTFTPTLVAYESRARRVQLTADPDPRVDTVARSLREQWDRYFPVAERDADPRIVEARTRGYRAWLATVGRMHREGVAIVTGTDLAARDVYPDSIHDEMAALVDAGLEPIEALRAATVVPAEFQTGDRTRGTLRPGALADLVVLDANPLEDVRNTRAIATVVVRGRLYDRAALDAMLARVRDEAPER